MSRGLHAVGGAVLFLVIFLLNSSSAQAQSCAPGWSYYAPVTVTNSTAGILTAHQVKVVVNTAALVTAGKMQASGNDIRFYDVVGCTSLPYWIENQTMNTAATAIWVKIPTLTPGASVFRMYYGNTTATAASNGTNTFEMFDDFNNLSAWTQCSGTNWATTTTPPAGAGTGSFAYKAGYNSATFDPMYNANYSMTNGVVETRFYGTNNNVGAADGGVYLLSRAGNCTGNAYAAASGAAGVAYSIRTVVPLTTTGTTTLTSTGPSTSLSASAWYRFRTTHNGTAITFNVDEGPLAPVSLTTTNASYTSGFVGLKSFQNPYVDWIFVRKFATTDPTTAVGPESQSLRGPANVVTGIQLWLKGDSVSYPAANPANSTPITTWQDVSGNNNDATVLAGQGTPALNAAQINGNDVVKFTRTSQAAGTVYNVPNIDIRSVSMPKTTIFTVYRQGTKGAGELHGIWGDDNGNWDRFFMPTGDGVLGGTNNGLVAVGPPTNFVQVNNAGVVGQTKLLTAVYDSGVVNGSTIYFNALPVQTVTDKTDPTAAQTTLRIGWDGDDNAYNGDIAEMILYNRKLTDCEIKAVNRYLGYKYGVALTTATITPAPDAFFCSGGSTTLTGASVTSGATFTWLQNGSLIAGANSSTYNATVAGNYQVIASAGGCADTSVATAVQEVFPTIYVDSSIAASGTGVSWASPKKTVWEALKMANAVTCATNIFVKKGTYYPMTSATAMATSRDSSLRILRNNIKLYGGFFGNESSAAGRTNIAGNATILSGDIGTVNDSTDNAYHVVMIVGSTGTGIDTTTVVDGFTVTRGEANGGGGYSIGASYFNRTDGGGLALAGNNTGVVCSPKVENCIFIRNYATFGAGMYSSAQASGISAPVVRNSTFTLNNTPNYGGGYMGYASGANAYLGATLNGNTFANNTGSGNGGGLFLQVTNATEKLQAAIAGCTFAGNFANNGGGFSVYGNDSTLVTVSNCTVTGNTAPTFGGGIYIQGTEGVAIAGCNISNNGNGYTGGGVMYNNAGGTITGCTFNGDTSLNGTSNTWGGAIADCFSSTVSRRLTITGSTFSNNKSHYAGGGIYMQDSTALTLINCTSSGHASQLGGFVQNTGNGGTFIVTGLTSSNDTATVYGASLRYGGPFTTTVTGSKFLNNYGYATGAIDHSGSPMNFTNCVFSGNKTNQYGAAICNSGGSITLNQCVLNGNSTLTTGGNGGGAVRGANGTTTTLNDCTLYNNTSASTGIVNSNAIAAEGGSTFNVNNTIIWGAAAIQVAGTGTVTYNSSDVRGITATGTNINTDPSFINPSNPIGPDGVWATADDGLELAPCSPAANTGSNALIPSGITTDITTAARIQNTTVDMGAYEAPAAGHIVYVNGAVATTGNGTTWSTAFKTVTEALNYANRVACADTIWVAAGTYRPMINATTQAASRDSSFRILRNGVRIFGGFVGNETAFSARNVSANVTILSGDLGVLNDSTDNAFHVMTIVGSTGNLIDTNTIVDGFTITRGRNNAGASTVGAVNGTAIASSDGGGILNAGNGTGNNCSPLIQNCIFTRNAGVYGAGVYNAAYSGGASNPYYRFCTFTINNGTGGGAAMSNYGTVVSPNISNCTFSYNRAPNNAGVDNNGSAGVSNTVFNSCTFIGNAATSNSGAISFSGGTSTPSVINCSFTGNTAGTGSGAGAAINLNGVTLTVSGSSFQLNKSYSGAGVECNNATLNISNSTFSLDTALFAGAALRNNNSTINATDCRFLNNYGATVGAVDNGSGTSNFLRCVFDANRAGAIGGALNNYNNSTAIFTNCVLTGNTTGNTGAGGGAVHASTGSTTTFNNSTLYNNTTTSTSPAGGNALSLDAGATANLNNTIIWGAATTQVANSGTLNENFSDVRGITAAGTNISADPQFINPANPIGADNIWATGDDGLRMTPCSPAINAGSNALVPAGITTDITNVAARIQNTTVDMGAYEMPYASTGLPSTTITMSPANPVCSNTSVTFTATTTAPGSVPVYQWYKNGVPVGSNQNTYTFNSWNNNDSVWVSHTNNDCSLSDTSNKIYIQITPVPAQPGTISGLINPCAGASQTYTISTVTGAATYTWTVPVGWAITAGQGTVSITATTSATAGNVTVTANNSCAVASTVSSLAVAPLTTPAAPVTITGPATTCAASTGNIYSTPAVTGVTTYTWTVPAGWTITAGQGTTSITVTAAAGTTSGNVTVTAGNGCQTSTAATLAVSGGFIVPTVSIAGNPSGAICQGTAVTFTATGTNGGTAPVYIWRRNGVTVTGTGNTYTGTGLNNGDIISVRMNSNAACVQPDSAVSSVTITVNPVPAITSATAGNPVTCSGASGTITLSGNFLTGVSYTVNYSRNGTAQPVATVTSSGTGAVILTGLNAGTYTAFTVSRLGCTSAAFAGPATLTDPAPPAAPVASYTNTLICAGNTLNLTASTIAGATYNWTGPNSFTSNTQIANVSNIQTNGAGTYSVTATVAGCISAPGTVAVAVNTIPVAPATITGNTTICGGSTNTYTASAVSNATSYAWTVPTGWTGTSATTTLTTTANSTSGTITVSAVNGCGPSPITSLAVTVGALQTPSVTIASSTGTAICSGASVMFTATPVNGGTAPTYQWFKNGSQVATGATYTTNTLANNDVITAVLTTSLSCTTAPTATSNAITMQVTSVPAQPGAITGATAVCNGVAQQYSVAAVTGATFYTWTLPSGWSGTSTGASILATPGAGGGTISVTAGNTCGPSLTAATLAVAVTSIPATPGAISGPVAPCANTSQTYSVPAVSGATSYSWSLPSGWSGSSATASITVTTGAGAGAISVTANNQCGPSATAQTLSVAPVNVPAAPAAITGNTTPCSGSAQTYSIAAVAGATSYTWTAPGGWTGTSTTASITYNTSTTAGAVQVQSNGVCGFSAFTSLSVNPVQTVTPSVTVSTPSTTICQNAGATFIANPTGGGASPSYQWKKNGVNVGANSPVYSDLYLVSGDVITVIMTSSAPCVTAATATSTATTVTVTPTVTPGVSINTVPPIVMCAGTPLIFTTTTNGGGTAPTYKWYKNGVLIPGVNTPNYNGTGFNNGDTITVLLTSNAVCRTMDTIRSNKVGLTVQPNVVPTAIVTASPGTTVSPATVVTFTANVTDGGATPAYQWYKNGTAIGFATNSTYTTSGLHDGDLISVRLISSTPCASPNMITSTPLRISVSTGVSTVSAGNGWAGSVTLYPNPNTGHFTVAADWGAGHSGERVRLELVNALGQIIYSSEVQPARAKWSVDVWLDESIANGLYQLRLKGADGGINKPVMIQR